MKTHWFFHSFYRHGGGTPSHFDLSLGGFVPLLGKLWPPFVFILLRIAFPACPRWPATPFLSHPFVLPGAVTPSMPRDGHGKSYCPCLARRHPISSGESYASGGYSQACGWQKPLSSSGLLRYCIVRWNGRCFG